MLSRSFTGLLLRLKLMATNSATALVDPGWELTEWKAEPKGGRSDLKRHYLGT